MTSIPQPGLVLCVTGAECTGKTTLASALATHLEVPLVPEVSRSYLEGRQAYTREDVLAIGRLQLEAERTALAAGSPVVVADTDVTVIQVWWEEKYGRLLDPWIAEALVRRTPRRYLLPVPDLPWEADPLRENPLDRQRLHDRYRQILEASEHPFAEVQGKGEQRTRQALARVDEWLRRPA